MGLNPLEVNIGDLRLRTPLMTASGTSGSTNEIERLADGQDIAGALGAFVSKGVTLNPRAGNPELRIVEADAGVINSIGLQNSGAATFVERELPLMLRYEVPIIVNISAGSVEEFGALAACLADGDENRLIAGVEVNVSCPNITRGGVAFGTSAAMVESICATVREHVRDDMLVITKLTPNVTDIVEPAKGAIAGGTHALSMINTLRGMAINVDKREPFLGNVYGGLSGPVIKPVGVFMVFECFRRIPECRDRRVPIIGIGGVSTAYDALEYILAGATGVGVGTAWFVDSRVFCRIRDGLAAYCAAHDTVIGDLIGDAHPVMTD